MMCKFCGCETQDGSLFCSVCGKDLSEKAAPAKTSESKHSLALPDDPLCAATLSGIAAALVYAEILHRGHSLFAILYAILAFAVDAFAFRFTTQNKEQTNPAIRVSKYLSGFLLLLAALWIPVTIIFK